MVGRLLWRGMLAGLIAACVAAVFALLFAEPQIDRAIAVEAAHRMPGMAQETEWVSRGVQKTAGLFTALAVYGAGVGGLFALAFAYAYGRIGQVGPRTLALLLAVLAFVVIVLVPAIKYPPTPPAVGQHETVKLRTAAFFAMIALSLVAAMVAAQVRRAVAVRWNPVDALLAAVACYALLASGVALLLPVVDEVPRDFGATLLWNFRLASLGAQALFWIVAGWLFGRFALPVLRERHG
ncbi:CbtA family protein [Sphingomonas adhaesiva]|uniref:CbtA family protein n=1 Tax=Sphingomonas adhaesiva TaxID=28212 RepID=UPI002FFAFEBE